MARNKRGQFTGKNIITWNITKTLQEVAKEAELRIKPMVRDKLEETLRAEVYASYQPATEQGKATQEYNETHKHQKARPYHHTGLLASKIGANIDGNTVKAVVRDGTYDNGATTAEVYDYLKFGTPDRAKTDVYDYNKGKEFSQYISQEPHNFEARTREQMRDYIEEMEAKIRNGSWKAIPGIDKYIDKVARKNRLG